MCRRYKQLFELLHDWIRRGPQLGHLCSDDDDMNNDDNDDYDDDDNDYDDDDNDYDDDYNYYNDDDDDDDMHDCMRRRPQLGHLCSDDDDMNNDDNDDCDDDDNDYNDDDDDDDVHDCMRRRGLSSATCAPTAAEENTPQFPTKCRPLGSRLLPSLSYVWLFVLHNKNGIGPIGRALCTR